MSEKNAAYALGGEDHCRQLENARPKGAESENQRKKFEIQLENVRPKGSESENQLKSSEIQLEDTKPKGAGSELNQSVGITDVAENSPAKQGQMSPETTYDAGLNRGYSDSYMDSGIEDQFQYFLFGKESRYSN